MKKLVIGLGILLVIALAMPVFADGNGAVVGKNSRCGIYVGDYGTGRAWTEDSQFVINENNWKLTCHGQITDNFPLKTVIYDEDTAPGGICGWGSYFTEDGWKIVITPSGQVTLSCHGTL
jgi:hypothetical protein